MPIASPIHTTNHFAITIPSDCFIPGYVIMQYKENARFLYEMPLAAQQEFGVLTAKLQHIILQLTHAEKIYLNVFGEVLPIFHLHIFPRTKTMAEDYITHQQQPLPLNGPLLFDWAKKFYRQESDRQQTEMIRQKIVQALR